MRHLWAIRTLDRLLVQLFLSHDLSLLSCSLCNTPFYSITSCWTRVLPPRSQKSEVKKRSQSCKMKGIENHFHTGETHDRLYYTVAHEPRRPRAARRADAIALRG